MIEQKSDRVREAARFAWPLAFVAAVAMTFSFLGRKDAKTTSEVHVQPTPTVVKSLREISRLETMSLHVEKVIDVKDQQKRLYGLLDTEDALLFVASGEVVIGIDLQ